MRLGRGRFQVRIALAVSAGCVLAAGCSLGLDQSLIGAHDAGVDAAVAQTDGSIFKTDSGTPIVDAGGDSGLATTCAKDADCFSNKACLTGRCDLSRGACVYDVCPTKGTTCSSAVCNNGTCGAPFAQKFAGAKISVPSGLSCNVAQRCITAVHPWVFVGTNAGVLAYPAIPAEPNPTPIVVENLPFLAQSIVASGNRIYVLGAILGAKLQAAWFDAPSDPLTKSISAQSDLLVTNHAAADLLLPLPALSALVTQQANPLYAGVLAAPFTTMSTVNQFDADAGAVQGIGTSGARLATFKINGANTSVQVFPNAGTADAGASTNFDTTAVLTTAAIGNVSQVFLASGPDGSLRAHYYTFIGPSNYRTRVAEIFENGTAGALSAKFPAVDVDTYTTASVAPAGPIAWIDSSSVLVASALPPSSPPTGAHVTWVDNKKTTPKSLSFPTAPLTSVVVAGSAGIGWTLTNDSATASSLYYISPACAP